MLFSEASISTSTIKHLVITITLSLFRAIRWLKRALQAAFVDLGHFLAPAGSIVFRLSIWPIYRLAVLIRLKLHKLLPNRGLALFFVSNRYLFHAVLGIASLITVIFNLRTHQVLAQDAGQGSLLYALATGSEVEIVNEEAPTERLVKNTHYLGDEALMAIPHIDFDYEEQDKDLAILTVPGTISAPPLPSTEQGSPRAPRTKTETYIVKEGDTIGSIAQEFSVNVGTILWSNNMTERQYIRPGDNLKIPPVSGVLVAIKKGDTLSKLADRYNGNEEEIREFNKIATETSLAVGTEIMIPGGRPPEPEQTIIAVVGRTREKASTDQKSQTTNPSSQSASIKKPADADTKDLPATRLLWPTTGRVITQYYGWRHSGLDIDGDFTSPLYASYDGVVQTAGWNSGGYGLQIVIQHPNGMKTRYAHASKLFVKVGDQVKRGQTIAMMGSTGRSTGSHLHFEVYDTNGVRKNPLLFTK